MKLLWHDRRGRFSVMRASTLVLLTLPFLALLYFAATHTLGARPRTEAIHEMGLWAIRLMLVSLFITPLRRIARYAPLVDIRRMIGVASFLYIALHLALYISDQMFDVLKAAQEIVLRIYLTIGFTALLGLMVLAATSNDYMVRQLGGLRWRNLHMLTYPIATLGGIHYFMQSKLEVFEPTVVAGLFVWLMLYRVLHWKFRPAGEFPIWVIAGSWFFVGVLTFLLEAIAFQIAFNAPLLRVLLLDFSFQAGIRPGWYVWGAGVIVTAIGLWRMNGAASRMPAASSGASPG